MHARRRAHSIPLRRVPSFPENGLASTLRCSMSQRNRAPRINRAWDTERAGRLPLNGNQSADVRGHTGPTRRTRGGGAQKRAVRDRVPCRERRQRPLALDDAPQNQPLGLLAVGALCGWRLMEREPRLCCTYLSCRCCGVFLQHEWIGSDGIVLRNAFAAGANLMNIKPTIKQT